MFVCWLFILCFPILSFSHLYFYPFILYSHIWNSFTDFYFLQPQLCSHSIQWKKITFLALFVKFVCVFHISSILVSRHLFHIYLSLVFSLDFGSQTICLLSFVSEWEFFFFLKFLSSFIKLFSENTQKIYRKGFIPFLLFWSTSLVEPNAFLKNLLVHL